MARDLPEAGTFRALQKLPPGKIFHYLNSNCSSWALLTAIRRSLFYVPDF